MSNRDENEAVTRNNGSTAPRTWRQRHGALLLLLAFGALTVLMIFLQKRAAA